MLNKLYVPKYDYAYILAGAPCSGKSYVLKHFLNNNNKIFNIDYMKSSLFNKHCKKIRENFISETDIVPEELNLYDYKDVDIIHNYFLKKDFRKRVFETFFDSIKNSKQKPTLFFDTTLRKLDLLYEIKNYLTVSGYNNIHIIWVFSILDKCLERNRKRKWALNEKYIVNIYYDIIENMKNLKEERIIKLENNV